MSGGPGAETISRECVRHDHAWCDRTVKLPADLIPDGQDSVPCACPCHAGWPRPHRERR